MSTVPLFDSDKISPEDADRANDVLGSQMGRVKAVVEHYRSVLQPMAPVELPERGDVSTVVAGATGDGDPT
ncbi:hypothetical protein [Brevundimonas sp.]|uniref:hypothetical protein n=1 Tax=Brevundimonas sp. TaxID=1871086 RepID=UPI002D280250|nr:hypothetical protein [Brevundimonas sp.]HYC96832.1 hypothetical protein [Brevundimonas sp.]